MSNVTISKELLQDLIDFAENYEYASDYFKGKHGLDAEYKRLVEQVRAILDTPASEVDPVTYTVRWHGTDTSGTDAQWLTEQSARDMVYHSNIQWGAGINHWAEGSDGSVIGYVGKPKVESE